MYPRAPDNVGELLEAYEHGLDDLDAALRGMSAEQLRARPVAGKWSTLEVVGHLCDSEQVYADRTKRAIAMERPLLIGYDETLFAARLNYHARDAAEEAALMRLVRKQMLRTLRTLPADAWERPAVHSERGLLTVKQLVQSAVGHLRHHLPFILEKRRALGL